MDQIFQDLIQAYNNAVEERDKQELPAWKLRLRRSFLNLIIREGKSSLIDIGAGTGLHGKYFQEGGLAVTCVDLSPANVQKCLAKGLEATALNLLDLALLDRSFDSAFAMNSLLHLPTAALPQALSSIAGVLRGGGLFFWGQYGGEAREGVYQDDHYRPKRFFSMLDDQQIQAAAQACFEIEDFTVIDWDDDSIHFQALLLRVPAPKPL